MLTKIANAVFPFLKECFELDIWSLDFFLIKNIHGLFVVTMELTAIWVYKISLIMMSICIKLEIDNMI